MLLGGAVVALAVVGASFALRAADPEEETEPPPPSGPPASYATPHKDADPKDKNDWSVPLPDKKQTERPKLPDVKVPPRTPKLEDNGMYPCSACHDPDMMETDPTPREVTDHDDIKMHHGGGRFWCLTCHHADKRDQLTSLKGEPISYDRSHLLCGQCHFQRQREFFFGAHGKRLGNWRGERTVMACVGCHDAHNPAIAPRRPYRPEKLREGLGEPHHPEAGAERVWEKRKHVQPEE